MKTGPSKQDKNTEVLHFIRVAMGATGKFQPGKTYDVVCCVLLSLVFFKPFFILKILLIYTRET